MNPIIHFFPDEKFRKPYIDFVYNNYSPQTHLFVISGKRVDLDGDKYKGIIYLEKGIKQYYEFYKILMNAKLIVIHSLLKNDVTKFFLLNPWFWNKIAIIFWGADFYPYIKPSATLKQRKNKYLKRILVKHCKVIGNLVDEDYQIIKSIFNPQGKHYTCYYVSGDDMRQMSYLREKKQRTEKSKTQIRIMVGNSATETNMHEEAFKLLLKFKHENIKIITPLSYGNKEYAKKIERIGKKLFAEKYIAINDFMSLREYNQFLSTIDIGIFNNNRQQAMGNIESLLYLGSKVYCRADTTMWRHYVNEYKASIYSVDEIKEMSFHDFIFISAQDRENNQRCFYNLNNTQRIKEQWDHIFNA